MSDCCCPQAGLPAKLDLQIYQGATFTKVFTWLTGMPPSPVDLSTASAVLTCKDASGTTIFALTSDVGGGIVLGGTAGTVTLSIAADNDDPPILNTSGLTPGTYAYDLLITFTNATVTALLNGSVVVTEGVTA